ncbi:hypothetical protein RvY_13369 [Ramazzottius varieornatus]|uniref:Uncharacterized protein n=1 Tax=Ramazzottius varieornatus TaxID=947166 RepID=A0A1D1VMN3_RAMVA|nr:hypothetical protein RvY_13369 [Ramazzottius varieornatus]
MHAPEQGHQLRWAIKCEVTSVDLAPSCDQIGHLCASSTNWLIHSATSQKCTSVSDPSMFRCVCVSYLRLVNTLLRVWKFSFCPDSNICRARDPQLAVFASVYTYAPLVG